jgi:hypothetical protein
VATSRRRLVRGRRKRVVLMPRRWHQPGDNASHCAGDGGKKARSPGRARHRPLKPFVCGNAGFSGSLVVTNSCAFYLCTRGCGCARRPAFPTPSQGGIFLAQLGCVASREGRGVSGSPLPLRERSDRASAIRVRGLHCHERPQPLTPTPSRKGRGSALPAWRRPPLFDIRIRQQAGASRLPLRLQPLGRSPP